MLLISHPARPIITVLQHGSCSSSYPWPATAVYSTKNSSFPALQSGQSQSSGRLKNVTPDKNPSHQISCFRVIDVAAYKTLEAINVWFHAQLELCVPIKIFGMYSSTTRKKPTILHEMVNPAEGVGNTKKIKRSLPACASETSGHFACKSTHTDIFSRFIE